MKLPIPTIRYAANLDASFARIVADSPAIRLIALPNRLASTALSVAQRLFLAHDARPAIASNRTLRSSPRGFYRFVGVPGASTALGSIDAFQLGPRDTRALRSEYFRPDNVPDACVHENATLDDAALQRDAEAVFDELQTVCGVLLKRLVGADDRIAPLINAPFDSYVEFKRYSIASESPGLLMNEHRDQTLLTLLIQSPAPTAVELQVKSAASADWLSTATEQVAGDADADETAIVHVGDLLERATHGRFLSTVHRVVRSPMTSSPTPPKERFSVALFCMPSWHVRLDESTQVGDLLPVYSEF